MRVYLSRWTCLDVESNLQRPRVEAGQTPAEVVEASGRFPELFAHEYATGEISGQLDDTLHRLHQYYQDDGSRIPQPVHTFENQAQFGSQHLPVRA